MLMTSKSVERECDMQPQLSTLQAGFFLPAWFFAGAYSENVFECAAGIDVWH
jgi:hypothetical protein